MTSSPDHGSAADVDEVDEIRLTLPALAPYARVARLAITGIASRNRFRYDDVQDLRIATGEAFGLLVRDDHEVERLRFTCRIHRAALEIEVERQPAAPLAEVAALSEQILAAVVDEVAIDREVGAVRLVKHNQAAR